MLENYHPDSLATIVWPSTTCIAAAHMWAGYAALTLGIGTVAGPGGPSGR